MQVRIIAIRFDDGYIVSSLHELESVTLSNVLKAVGKETHFDQFLVIDSSLNQIEFYNHVSNRLDEEEE